MSKMRSNKSMTNKLRGKTLTLDLMGDDSSSPLNVSGQQMNLLGIAEPDANAPASATPSFKMVFDKIPRSIKASIVSDKMVAPKNSIGIMEFPFLGISNQPIKATRSFDYDGGVFKMVPHIERDALTGEEVNYGLPTIYDFDIVIFVFSLLMKSANEGGPISKSVQFRPIDYFRFVSDRHIRSVSGSDLQDFKKALVRLKTASISTNIISKGAKISKGNAPSYRSSTYFSFLTELKMVSSPANENRISHIYLELSDWMYAYVVSSDVLTISPDYFKMSGLHRSLYNHFRKHCGHQAAYSIRVSLLHKKIGASKRGSWLTNEIKKIAERDRDAFFAPLPSSSRKKDNGARTSVLGNYFVYFCEKTKQVKVANTMHKKGMQAVAQHAVE